MSAKFSSALKGLRDRENRVVIATLILFVLCFLIGGASQRHAFRLALIELAALPVLGMAIVALIARTASDGGLLQRHRFALGILGATLALPLVQILPLPPAIWTALPGRESSVLALELTGVTPGWGTSSLVPDLTWQSWLALLPPAAVFLGFLAAPPGRRRWLAPLVLAITAASVVLGLAQAAGGSRFYVWPTTGAGSISGFMANRNHLATLCLVSIPFAAAIIGRGLRRGREGRADVLSGAIMAGVAVLALAAIRSRFGIVMALPVLLGSGLVLWRGAAKGRVGVPLLALAASAGAALTVIVALGVGPVLERFDAAGLEEGRLDKWPTVAEAAQTYLPLGGGFGSFNRVYRSVEPLEEVDPTYFNRAHNDYLETWLEGGWASVAILIAFLVWFFRRGVDAWRHPPSSEADLRRAASVGIVVILAHSAVDYPLRTVAVAAVLAACAAVLETPSATSGSSVPVKRRTRLRRAPA